MHRSGVYCVWSCVQGKERAPAVKLSRTKYKIEAFLDLAVDDELNYLVEVKFAGYAKPEWQLASSLEQQLSAADYKELMAPLRHSARRKEKEG